MNKIQVGGFIRISKREAERRYNAGEIVRFCACKLSPVNIWGCFCDCKRISTHAPLAGRDCNSHVEKMYQDKKDGTTVFCGYVIGGLWLQLYEVQPVEKAV